MTTLTQKCQVTIPKHVRELTGLGPGDQVEFKVTNNKVLLEKKKASIEKYRGFLGKGSTKKIMQELR